MDEGPDSERTVELIEPPRRAEDIELPDPPERPEAEVDEEAQKPLIDSRWGFVAGTQALKARKAYEDGDEAADGE
jgi:hypothetical protein